MNFENFTPWNKLKLNCKALVSSTGRTENIPLRNKRLDELYDDYTCDKQVLWESAIFFPRDNSLVSDRKSHNSDFFGLAVRCLLFNPEGPGSNPCLCANCSNKIFEAEDSQFFRQYETPPPPFSAF